MSLIERLGVQIGVRTAGSAQAGEAVAAIVQCLRETALEPHLQRFTFVGYEPETPELTIAGEQWDVGPCNYSPRTPPDGVKGTIRYVGTNVARRGTFETPVFGISDGTDDLARLYVNRHGGAISRGSFYPGVLGGPAACVSRVDGERLRDLLGTSAVLRTGGTLRPGMSDVNIRAEIEGERSEAVVVCAHFDSAWRAPGAVDNATGVEGVRRLVKRFRGRELPRSVIFCLFSGEELGLLGSTYFVTEAKLTGELERIVGVVNLDCVANPGVLEVMAAPQELENRAREIVRTLGTSERYATTVAPSLPGSDHWPFAVAGIPNAALTYLPFPEYHTPDDTIDLVDEARLEAALEIAEAIVESQLERPVSREA